MTERDEMVALAEMIEDSYQGDFVQDILLNEAERRQIANALRSAARTDDAGYAVGFEACREAAKKVALERAHGLYSECGRTAGKAISNAIAALPAPGGITTGIEAALRDDPTSDERWSAGLDFAMIQLCTVMGVDPHDVTWDAATEEVEGDVRAVIGNILRAKLGDDWSPRTTTPQPEAVEADRIPSSDDMDARFAWLEAKAIDMGYVLTPEPEHPDSPHRSPIAPDERMRRALDLAVNIIMANEPGDSRAVSDVAVALAAVASGDTSGPVMAVIDKALSGADDASNASAEARLPGMDWELSDDAKSRIAEIDRCIVRPGDPRLNQIIGGPRPAGADEAKKSEGATKPSVLNAAVGIREQVENVNHIVGVVQSHAVEKHPVVFDDVPVTIDNSPSHHGLDHVVGHDAVLGSVDSQPPAAQPVKACTDPTPPDATAQREAIAAFLIARDEDETNPEQYMDWAHKLLSAGMTEEHCGDCTQQCHTCVVCVAEINLANADRILALSTRAGGWGDDGKR